jgi:hypothetical protein
MTGIRRQKAQSEQAAALLAGSLERQAGTRCQQNDQLRVRAGRGVLRKQAENAVERSENGNMLGTRTRADPSDPTSPSRLGHSCKPRRGVQQNVARSACARSALAAAQAAAGWW